jgi:hypothetical protein
MDEIDDARTPGRTVTNAVHLLVRARLVDPVEASRVERSQVERRSLMVVERLTLDRPCEKKLRAADLWWLYFVRPGG